MKKFFQTAILVLCMASCVLSVHAQIGYQISLLNTATGEPRANETVNVTVTLTNNEDKVIYTGNQSATTNDFGVLSLTIGDAKTFKDVDFSKFPFFVEVSANGVMIGKSQVLSVPVAEGARTLMPYITKEELCSGVWILNPGISVSFTPGGSCQLVESWSDDGESIHEGIYEIEGKNIYMLMEGGKCIWHLRFMGNQLYRVYSL